MKHIISYYSINLIVHYACNLFNVSTKDFYSKKSQSKQLSKCRYLVWTWTKFSLNMSDKEVGHLYNRNERPIRNSVNTIKNINDDIRDKFEVFAENALSKKGFQPDLFDSTYTFINRI